jgi:hypothetical protein
LGVIEDYRRINDPDFIAEIRRTGEGSRWLDLPPQALRRRFEPEPLGNYVNRPRGTYEVVGGELRMTWHTTIGWEPQGPDGQIPGIYGVLHLVYEIDGRWTTKPIAQLRRPEEEAGIVLLDFDALIPRNAGPLLAVWFGGKTTDRRTDLAPLRYSPEPSEPSPPDEPPSTGIPDLADVRVRPEGTPTVLSWPVLPGPVDQVSTHGDQVFVGWPAKDRASWPTVFIDLFGDTPQLGTVWAIAGSEAGPIEHVRDGQRAGKDVPLEHVHRNLPFAPRDGEIVGMFLAGPSRSSPDLPEYRRRTPVSWWRWRSEGEMELLGIEAVQPGEPDEPPVEPPPPAEPPEPPEPPDEPEPPDCAEQVRSAIRAMRLLDARRLDAIERRLNDEVIRPFQALGLLGKIFQGPRLLRHAEAIIEDDYRPLIQDMKGERP